MKKHACPILHPVLAVCALLAFPALADIKIYEPVSGTGDGTETSTTVESWDYADLTPSTLGNLSDYALSKWYEYQNRYKPFDNDDSTIWMFAGVTSGTSVGYAIFDFGAPTVVNAYGIKTGDTEVYCPKGFSLWGSNSESLDLSQGSVTASGNTKTYDITAGGTVNTDIVWTQLDARDSKTYFGSAWKSATHHRIFKFTNTTPYRYYKWQCDSITGGNGQFWLRELELYRVSSGGRLTVCGNPGDYGVSSPAYGISEEYAGQTVAFTAPADGDTPDGDAMFSCSGYEIATAVGTSDDWTTVVSGTISAGMSFQHFVSDETNTRVTWIFDTLYNVSSAETENGTVSGTGFYAQGSSATLTASPAPGYRFVSWSGDVPEADRFSATVTLSVSRALAVAPLFIAADLPSEQYVATDGDDANDGFSAEFPKATIPAALDMLNALGGGTMFIAPGTYTNSNIELTRAIVVGGTTGDPADVVIDATKAPQANSTRRVFRLNHPDAVVHSLTMRGGYTYQISTGGAGALIDTAGGTVSNCVVTACNPGHQYDKGSVVLLGETARLTRCRIVNNTLPDDATWSGNSYGQANAAVNASAGRIDNCLVSGTAAGDTYQDDITKSTTSAVRLRGTAVIENCTIVGNNTHTTGGIFFEGTGASAVNCVVAGNTTPWSGTLPERNGYVPGQEALYTACAMDSALPVNGTCVVGTTATFFRDYAAGDLRPDTAGPLVNRGAALASAPALDLAGNPRVVERIDIGAFEGPAAATLLLVR